MKKNFIMITIILFIVMITNISIIHADSGFDTSYDTDSSSSSISGGSNSYYGSNDSSGNYIGVIGNLPYTDFVNEHPVIFVILSIFILTYIAFIFFIIFKKIANLRHRKKSYFDSKLTKNLEPQIIEIFKKIQNAWSNLDLSSVREYLSDELYNSYSMQILKLKENGQRNIIKNIIVTDINITSISKYSLEKTIKCVLTVMLRDYIIDSEKKVIRGSKNIIYENTYELTLNYKLENIDICPNCGANIEGKICKYCTAIIPNNKMSLSLSKKEIISQVNNSFVLFVVLIIALLIIIGIIFIFFITSLFT